MPTLLWPWEGEHVVFLTPSSDLDRKVMGIFLRRLDDGWQVYADLVPRAPTPFKTLKGKVTIAAVPDIALTGGYGCGYVGLTGIEVAARAQKMDRPPGVIILSVHGDETYIMRALAAGARAYLLKSATDEDLIPAVRAVAAGKPFFSPAVTAVLVEDYVRRLQQRGLTDSYHLLTDREKEVLQLLAEGRANKEVATLLDLSLSTVETHRANLMQKLNLHNTAEIVLYAVRKGLIVQASTLTSTFEWRPLRSYFSRRDGGTSTRSAPGITGSRKGVP